MPKAAKKSTRVAKRPSAKSKPITDEFKRAAMSAYAEFLHMELRLLSQELEPGYEPIIAPVNTAATKFHFPDRSNMFAGWQKYPPSSRAIPMMKALRIDVANHVARDERLQREFDRRKAISPV